MLAFAHQHNAMDVPVVLTGDLNAKDCDELAGIARALVRLNLYTILPGSGSGLTPNPIFT